MNFSQIKKKLTSSKNVLTDSQKSKIKGGTDGSNDPSDPTNGIGTVDTADI